MIVINRTAFLNKMNETELLKGQAFTSEDGGHQFVITCRRDGEDVALSGTVTGRFMRADGVSVQLTPSYAGITEDGKAWVILPANCYTVRGQFALVIFHTDGDGHKCCIYSAAGYVRDGVSEQIVDPENVIDVDAIQAMIGDLQDAIEDAQAQATSSVQYTPQSLTKAQREQGRTNIGAAADYVESMAATGSTDIISEGEVRVPCGVVNCSISSTNYTARSSTRYQSLQIDAGEYKTITLTANSEKAGILVFLKTAIPDNIGDAADVSGYLSDGETGRHLLDAGETGTFVIPDGTKYLFIVFVSNYLDFMPAKVTVTGKVERRIAKLESDVGRINWDLTKEVTFAQNIWTSGGWGTQNGQAGNNAKRIRTASGRLKDLKYIVKADPGYVFIVLFYEADGTYVPQASYPAWTECSIGQIAPAGAAEFRLVARTDPESDISEAVEATGAKIHFHMWAKVDKDQGAANAGKFLAVGEDGIVRPAEAGGDSAASESLKNKLVARRTGNGFMKADGSIQSLSGTTGRIQKARLPRGTEKVYVTATMNWDAIATPYCILWFVKNGEMIANGYIPVTTKPQSWTEYEVTVPDGCDEVWFDRLVTVQTDLELNDKVAGRVTALENSHNLFTGAFTFAQRVLGMRMAADAHGLYFIPFNACGQGVSRGNGLHGDDYYRDNIHPTQLGAYNTALGIWSRLKNIPRWYTAVPETHAQALDGTQWQGKTWYAYGTSLTQGTVSDNKYADFVAEMSGMTLVNKGYGGGALVTNRQIYNRLLDMTDGKLNADLITIEVGANDGGEMGDPWGQDIMTFFGALNHCIHEMFAAGVQAQVVLMASTQGRYLSTDSSVKFDVNRLYNA